MRLTPWSRGRVPTGGVGEDNRSDGAVGARALTAGGERIDISDRGEADRARKRKEDWQLYTWEYFDSVPEVLAALRWRASMISKARLTAAWVPAVGETPVPLDATETVTEDGVTTERFVAPVHEDVRRIALDTVARLDQSPAGIPGILSELTFNLDLPGDCYLVGFGQREQSVQAGQVVPGMDESWEVVSLDEVETGSDGRRVIKEAPRAVKDGVLTEDDFLGRIWQRHPRKSSTADSPMRAVLSVCEELMILARAARAWGLSRLNAGILKVPDELSFGPPDPTIDGDTSQDAFKRELTTALVTPIQDEGSAGAVVPPMVFGPAEALAQFDHMTLGRPIDEQLDSRMELRVKRLGRGLDCPPERIEGHQLTTFANADNVSMDEFRSYLEPTLMQLCASLTTAFFRPLLEAAGVDRALVRQLVVWYDASELVAEPDKGPSADAAHERLAISDAAYRRERGYSEEDAPSEEEILQRTAIKRGMIDAPLTETLLRLLLENLPVVERPALPPAGDGVTAALSTRSMVAASSGADVGRRLMSIDRSLRERLEALADRHMRRALELAGARLRSKTASAAHLRKAVEDVPQAVVAQTLGRSVVAAVGLTEDELLESAFEDMRDEFDQRVRRAQAAALDALDDAVGGLDESERADIEQQQERDRGEAWAWLLAALLGFARTRLFDPAPEAQPGEFDGLTTVPPGLVREAVARAGGEAGLASTNGRPAGGVATGQLVQEVFARHGAVVQGWQWVYGDPSTRQTNFAGHLALDGVEFPTWDDDVLAVRGEDAWLGVSHYKPSDHLWCSCDFSPVLAGTVES